MLSRFPVVVLKAGGLKSKLRNAFTYAPHTGGIGHLVNAVPVFYTINGISLTLPTIDDLSARD
jgi:hypothetical protein